MAPFNLATELLDRHVVGPRGSATAVVADDGEISYGALEARVNQIGNVLRDRGVRPGDRVVLRLPNSVMLVAVWLAVQKLGAIGVTTAPALRAREIAHIIDDVEPRLCVVAAESSGDALRARATTTSRPGLLVTGVPESDPTAWASSLDGMMAHASADLAPVAIDPGAIAIIAYTAGTGVAPKGACHSAADMLASARAYARQVLGCSEHDVVAGHPSLSSTYGLGALLIFPLLSGATVVLTAQFSAEGLLRTIDTRRVSLLFCTPTAYRMLLRVPNFERRFDLSSLRLCVSAGEPLDADTYDAWTGRTHAEMIDGLGTTEMFHVFLSQRPGEVVRGSLGRAVPGYEIRLVDDAFAEVPAGATGLLTVRGPSRCCYWRNPAAQREYVRHGWNVTGDLARRDEHGQDRFRGRKDDLIISAGYNIAGPEVEAVLREHPAVADVAVVAAPDPIRGAVPRAWIVVKAPAAAGDGLAFALQQHAQAGLAGYKCPRQFEFIEALPRTAAGDVDRAALRARGMDGT